MKARINGIEVEGTPEEISRYRVITTKANRGTKKFCSCLCHVFFDPNPFCERCGGKGYYYD